MSTTPPEAPAEPGPGSGPRAGQDDGPRVTRDEIRDLARLRRSRSDRKIAGVAGGLARHLDIDPLIPRVLLVVLVFFGGAGLLLYGVIWLVVPVEGTDEATIRLDDRSRTAALVIVGALAALALVGDILGGWGFPWPLAVAGLAVLAFMSLRHREPRPHPGPYVGSYGPPPAPGFRTASMPYDAFSKGSATAPPPPAPTPPPVPRSPRRRGPLLFPYALALVALGVGVLGIADTAGAGVPDSAYPAYALGTCAVLLLVGAFWGRAGGIILLGIVAAFATLGATLTSEYDAGHIEATPTSAASVEDRYDLAFGEIELDLSEVSNLEALDGRTIEVEVEVAGHVEVVVPDDVDLVLRTSVDAGERVVFGDRLDSNRQPVVTIDGGVDVPELTIDATVAFGQIDIVREGALR